MIRPVINIILPIADNVLKKNISSLLNEHMIDEFLVE